MVAVPARAAVPPPGRGEPAPPEEELPVPPIPPDSPPDDVAAPVPNVDLYAPTGPVQEGTTVRGTLNERSPTLPGGDPIPGTLYRYDQEQKRQYIPNPGIQLVVPLQK
jgi:hypothetical protein